LKLIFQYYDSTYFQFLRKCLSAERVPLELQAFKKKALQFSHHLTIEHAYFDSFQFTKSQLASI
jgi:hypothetical protein